jgi:hypothetical protein
MDDKTVTKPTRTELVSALRQRYKRVPKLEKRTILDEFTKVSGYHRCGVPR